MNIDYKQLRVGLIGLGLEAYWEQFEGLEQRLLGYLSEVERKIASPSRVTFNFGLVDTPQKAVETGHRCRRSDIDILLVYVTTYALSATVLPVILRAKVPVVLLNLQPGDAIEYEKFNRMADRTAMTGEWLAWCSACPMPEIANVLGRLDVPFRQVTGTLDGGNECWLELGQWLRAAEVVHALSHSRLGLMGHYYSGMLDIATDLAQVSGRFCIHIEHLEVDELSGLRGALTTRQFRRSWKPLASSLRWAKTAPPKSLRGRHVPVRRWIVLLKRMISTCSLTTTKAQVLWRTKRR